MSIEDTMADKAGWTVADDMASEKDGWTLRFADQDNLKCWVSYHTSAASGEIFHTYEEACAHVTEQALLGDALCIKALGIMRRLDPNEYGTTTGGGLRSAVVSARLFNQGELK